MKKKFLFIIMALLLIINVIALGGCDILGSFDDDDDGGLPQIDNSVDLDEYTPTAEDDYIYIEDEIYYTSKSVDLVTEINGNYTTREGDVPQIHGRVP